MAVFTKLNQADISYVQNIYGFKKIKSFKGIKKGIENTNYIVNTNNKKYVLTIFESRVSNRDLPYFMKLMDALSKKGIKCPSPIKNKYGKSYFEEIGGFFFSYIKNYKSLSSVDIYADSLIEGKDKLPKIFFYSIWCFIHYVFNAIKKRI